MGADDLAPLVIKALKHSCSDGCDPATATLFALLAAQHLGASVISEVLLASALRQGAAMDVVAALLGVHQLQPSVLGSVLIMLVRSSSCSSYRTGAGAAAGAAAGAGAIRGVL
jgi:hypothetical protein